MKREQIRKGVAARERKIEEARLNGLEQKSKEEEGRSQEEEIGAERTRQIMAYVEQEKCGQGHAGRLPTIRRNCP